MPDRKRGGGGENRTRQKVVGVRLNRDEYGALLLTADALGKKPPTVLREAFLASIVPEDEPPEEDGHA